MKTYSRDAFALSLRLYGCNCESCRTSAVLWEDEEPSDNEPPEEAPESGDSDGDGPIVLDGDDENEP